MAGRIQILTRGYAGEYLTTNPDSTYFNNRYARYTNFSKESFSLKPTDQKDVTTGDTVNFRIPIKRGDLLNGLSVSFTIPENLDDLNSDLDISHLSFVTNTTYDPDYYGPQITPIDHFGISVIEYVDLYIGDQLLDRITSDDIFIYTQTQESSSYEDTQAKLNGDDFLNSISQFYAPFINSKLLDGQFTRIREYNGNFFFTRARYNESYTSYNVEIPFYFHNRSNHGFPLCALEYQELEVRIKLRNAKYVLFPVFHTTSAKLTDGGNSGFPDAILWNYLADSTTRDFTMSNFNLNVDVTYLDAPERMKLKCQIRDILIEQRQHNYFQMEGGVKNKKFRLDFKNCVKEMYFIARRSLDLTTTQINTITTLFNSLYKTTNGSDPAYLNYNFGISYDTKLLNFYTQKAVPCMYTKHS